MPGGAQGGVTCARAGLGGAAPAEGDAAGVGGCVDPTGRIIWGVQASKEGSSTCPAEWAAHPSACGAGGGTVGGTGRRTAQAQQEGP